MIQNVKSEMKFDTETPNKIKSSFIATTEMRFVMYAVPEKTKTMLESRKRDFFVQWRYLLKRHNNDTKWNLQFKFKWKLK